MVNKQPSFMGRSARRALAASGIAAAALYGWWQAIDGARTTPSLPDIQTGTTLPLGKVTLTPLSVQLRPPSSGKAEAQLVLTATVENVTSTTQSGAFGYPPRLVTVQAAGQPQLNPPDITLLRDHQPLQQLQPRMPEQVEIVWDIPANWPTQEWLFTFHEQQFKLKDNLYARANWLGYSPAAHMAVVLEAEP